MGWRSDDPVKRREAKRRYRQSATGKAARRRERKNRRGRPAQVEEVRRRKRTIAEQARARVKSFEKRSLLGPMTAIEKERLRRYLRAAMGADGMACEYCAVSLESNQRVFDHVIPVSMGGPSTPENVACACNSCNAKKSARTPEAWGPRRVDLVAAAKEHGVSQRSLGVTGGTR